MNKKIGHWHIGIAAEAVAAAQFARCGYDVSVQYGANQPEYDLIIARDAKLLKVSVKGSQDGGWGLTQSYIKNADYHGAVDTWLRKHHGKTIYCLVQFENVNLDEMPRLYLASTLEVARRLKESRDGRGETILWENKKWTKKAQAAGSIDKIPQNWKFSPERVEEFFKT